MKRKSKKFFLNRNFAKKGVADFYNEDRKMATYRESVVDAHEKEKRLKKLRDMGMI